MTHLAFLSSNFSSSERAATGAAVSEESNRWWGIWCSNYTFPLDRSQLTRELHTMQILDDVFSGKFLHHNTITVSSQGNPWSEADFLNIPAAWRRIWRCAMQGSKVMTTLGWWMGWSSHPISLTAGNLSAPLITDRKTYCTACWVTGWGTKEMV